MGRPGPRALHPRPPSSRASRFPPRYLGAPQAAPACPRRKPGGRPRQPLRILSSGLFHACRSTRCDGRSLRGLRVVALGAASFGFLSVSRPVFLPRTKSCFLAPPPLLLQTQVPPSP